MKHNIILACTEDGIVGNTVPKSKYGLQWHFPKDLKHFKNTTQDSILVLGSSTFRAMNYCALPNRTVVVLTRDKSNLPENKTVKYMTIEEYFLFLETLSKKAKIFLAGGPTIINLLLRTGKIQLDKIFLTVIKQPEGLTDKTKLFKFTGNIKIGKRFVKFIEKNAPQQTEVDIDSLSNVETVLNFYTVDVSNLTITNINNFSYFNNKKFDFTRTRKTKKEFQNESLQIKPSILNRPWRLE